MRTGSKGGPLLTGVLVALVVLAGCGPQAAPVATGKLCLPATDDCPATRTVERTGPGSNRLDISIRNSGPPAVVDFTVESADTADDAFSADTGEPGADEGRFAITYRVGSDETISDRFVPNDIFSRKRLELTISCSEECQIDADFVLASEPIDCESDDDCGNRRCRETTGVCVECLEEADCEDEQTCDTQSGRCLPPAESGCAAAGDGQPSGATTLILALALLALAWRRRSSRSSTLRAAPTLALLALLLLPNPATAVRPPSSTLSLGGGPRFVTGSLGSNVKRGIGAELRETLRWKYFGTSFWIETNYFVTTQQPPPLTNEVQIFGFGVAPRAYIPIGRFDLSVGGGYKRVGFAPNALVRRTGTRANFNAVGGFVNGGFHFSSFVVRTGVEFYPILGAEGSLLSINVSFGVATE